MALNWVTRPPSALQLVPEERLVSLYEAIQLNMQSYGSCAGILWLTTQRMVFVQAHRCYACAGTLQRQRSHQSAVSDQSVGERSDSLGGDCVPLPLMHLSIPLDKVTDLETAALPFLQKISRLATSQRKQKTELVSMRLQPTCGSRLEDAASGNPLRCLIQLDCQENATSQAFFQQLRYAMASNTLRIQLDKQQARALLYAQTHPRLPTPEETAASDPVPAYEQFHAHLPVYVNAS
ncbi:hypothetical protein BCR37DRAFT_392762 [Protomyces lactucae-debilis]|uniref:Uncharacterized protein n=1 Tax=Protomyces lactucae-debilis TaxID=2754530 RepID=A0A1Y2FF46_PROLT|nr:uncharacterized protein BCR37DRAFT_392762 [Protomyces lactucae-debilis]ORY82553.1 hypothetical protein BCR37DRAFT_392762 [Protomyces lactucae-debilis]